MAHDLLVAIPASQLHGTMMLYLYQLEQAGIDFWVIPQPPEPNLGGRIVAQRSIAKRAMDYDALIFSDGFDVLFYGDKQDVLDKIPMKGILSAAEKNCYPDHIEISGETPWKYVNGGLSAGTPRAFLDWCDEVKSHSDYRDDWLDQQFLNLRLAEGKPLCGIDSRTELFFCLFGGYDELEFRDGLPFNTLCGTSPNFIHANGKWEVGTALMRYIRSKHASGEPESNSGANSCRVIS